MGVMETQVPRLGCAGQSAHSTLSCKVDEGVVVADKNSLQNLQKTRLQKETVISVSGSSERARTYEELLSS